MLKNCVLFVQFLYVLWHLLPGYCKNVRFYKHFPTAANIRDWKTDVWYLFISKDVSVLPTWLNVKYDM